jgi:outer membrane immunogenic protein
MLRLALFAVWTLIAAPAFAADLPVKAPPAAVTPAFSWTGFYLGGSIGYGWARADVADQLAAPGLGVFSTTLSTEHLKGVLGGAQLGYNWQLDWLVFGVEGDFAASDQSFDGRSGCVFGGVAAPGCTINASDRIQWFGTARGRLGFAADRILVYATGGAAWQELESSGSLTLAGAGTFPVLNSTTTKAGYTLGGGIEAALWGNWSAGIEYLYIDTGTRAVATVPLSAALGTLLATPAGTTVAETIQMNDSIARLRINCRF